jgi:hypothetical protein
MEHNLGDALDGDRWIAELQLAEVYDWSTIERYEMLSTISELCFGGEELWNMVLSTGATEEPVAKDLWGFISLTAKDLWGFISLPGVRRSW